MEKRKNSAVKMDVRPLMYIHVNRVSATNRKLNRATIEEIKRGLDTSKLAAFPAWHERWSDKWVITDGNHRLQALKELQYEYAPIIEITAEEFCRLWNQKDAFDIMVRVPKKIKVIDEHGKAKELINA